MKTITDINNTALAKKQRHEELLGEITKLRKKLIMQEDKIQKLSKQALEDTLTGLANRRAFDRALKQSLSDYKRYNYVGAILLIDVNQFKSVNDSLGHLAGDEILKHVANIIQVHTRETDFIARIGGDEFCVILKEATPLDAELKAVELEASIAHTPCWYEGREIHTSVSIGACSFSESSNFIKIMEKADKAMYANKHSEVVHTNI